MADNMRRLYPQLDDHRVESVPLCVDADEFYFSADPGPARQKLGLPTDRPLAVDGQTFGGPYGVGEPD